MCDIWLFMTETPVLFKCYSVGVAEGQCHPSVQAGISDLEDPQCLQLLDKCVVLVDVGQCDTVKALFPMLARNHDFSRRSALKERSQEQLPNVRVISKESIT